MTSEPCYATKLNNVVWQHKDLDSAENYARMIAQNGGCWRDYYIGFVSDWDLYKAHNREVDIRNVDATGEE